MLFVSAILLLYSAAVVPFQICMWDYNDPCNVFPTLQFDMFVDVFFMVGSLWVELAAYGVKNAPRAIHFDHRHTFRSSRRRKRILLYVPQRLLL